MGHRGNFGGVDYGYGAVAVQVVMKDAMVVIVDFQEIVATPAGMVLVRVVEGETDQDVETKVEDIMVAVKEKTWQW